MANTVKHNSGTDSLTLVQPTASANWQVVNVTFTATQNKATICLAAGGVEIGRFHEVLALN